ncbi:MAG: MaoC family dehydratase N-terminal domain-containing protein [Chloroflexi bacterium]|nr:MaoC family dehydratase N-terminal domain-containing protein [Chloroflexota bacterium]
MTTTRLVTNEVKKMIGLVGEPYTWPEPLDRSAIRRFVQATYEQKPQYADPSYAADSAGLCAPPAYVIRPPFGFWDKGMLGEAAIPEVHIPGTTRTVNGGNECEWFRPVREGDTITQQARIADIYERIGRGGPFAAIIAETVFTNQRGELVAVSRQTTIRLT